MENKNLARGSLLMVLGALSFVGYGIVFYYLTLKGSAFELGVATLNGLTRADLTTQFPEIIHYMDHIHVALSGFIISTGLAVAAIAHYSVRKGKLWAWVTAVASPVIALGFAIPMHYMNLFSVNWITHLAPIYIGTIIFVIGALMAIKEIWIMRKNNSASNEEVKF